MKVWVFDEQKLELALRQWVDQELDDDDHCRMRRSLYALVIREFLESGAANANKMMMPRVTVRAEQ